MDTPLVTIAIPVYNGANFVGDAIQSALDQTYQNIEILVVNDGSRDNGATRGVVESFGSRIRYIEKENGGVSTALNLAIAEMRGEYFSWLSHDDIFMPRKTELEVAYALANNAKIVYADYKFVNENKTPLPDDTFVTALAEKGNIFYQLLIGYPVNGCTTLIHKDVFKKVGFFRTDLPTTQDYDFWFRCTRYFDFHLLKEEVMLSRVHPNQDSKKLAGHFIECDALYTNIGSYIVADKQLRGLGSEQLVHVVKSLIKREYVSAAVMCARGLGKFRSALLVPTYLILHIVRKIFMKVAGLFTRKKKSVDLSH